MSGYVIFVDFKLVPGSRESFRRHIDTNARSSCEMEPGCRRFDVLEPLDDPDRILLYEIYDDRKAFDQHVRTPHFAAFDAATATMIEKKTVIACNLACEGSFMASA
jgi:autoinducer 2-degrading protein